ncbi:ATP-binding protein [Actinophytocola xanthii]|uniref:ATP-binding protein n=1 Tax=Actinophytocola xanthii TaxID=1912961 RepID=UPI0009F90CFF|nr:AAA family ATPase [Actinophytocola xanthii]
MVFVGRARELDELRAAYDRRPGTVLIVGDAGMGKSRLVGEFGAGLAGARVLTGGCLDLGENRLAFAPFTAVLRELVGNLGADGVCALLPGGVPGELGRLLPTLGPPAAGDASLARARLFEQVLTVLGALGPVVLVVEDLQWADRSTRDLLTFLVGNQRALPEVLVVLTCRTDLDQGHPGRRLTADLARVEWVRVLDLGPLSRREVAAQVRGHLGHEPDGGLVDRVYSRGEGNPLFVEALLTCLGAPGPAVPQSVRDLLLEPMASLPAVSQEVVRAASASGALVGHELLAAVTGLGDVELSAALRLAVAANLLVVVGHGYQFRHALIREMVHEGLLPGERAALHVRYAEALEQDPSLAGPDEPLPSSPVTGPRWRSGIPHAPWPVRGGLPARPVTPWPTPSNWTSSTRCCGCGTACPARRGRSA